jgi:hypothetical protein
VLLAEVSAAVQTIAGGGVTGMLVIVMTAFLRRTKDTDTRRDEFSKIVLDASAEREARAWTERDAALAERDRARAELDRVRDQFEQERKQWMTQTPRRPRPKT